MVEQNVILKIGNCLDVLRSMPDNSVDSCVTDPPYGLKFMGKKWDHDVPNVELWCEVLRVLKPGGHLLAFAGTRTQHRMAVNIEDAGFEIRDMIAWVYSSGFPKSRNIGKDIEKINVGGIKNLKQVGTKKGIKCETGSQGYSYNQEYVAGKCMGGKQISGDIPVYEINNDYGGFGTALKPALEPITLARKPLSENTVAANVLQHGTGAINIDECRVPYQGDYRSPARASGEVNSGGVFGAGIKPFNDDVAEAKGRFPANLIHDGSDEVLELFPATRSGNLKAGNKRGSGKTSYDDGGGTVQKDYGGDTGSASRFFYCPKASKKDRDEGCEEIPLKRTTFAEGTGLRNNGDGTPRNQNPSNRNHHVTVKPTDLMRYLCRLITPPNGIVLDPFMGSGSTGKAAILEGFQFIGIEIDEEYMKIAEARITHELEKR